MSDFPDSFPTFIFLLLVGENSDVLVEHSKFKTLKKSIFSSENPNNKFMPEAPEGEN
jgi:hypothetical protein